METALREMGHADLQMTELEEIESLWVSSDEAILIGIAVQIVWIVIWSSS